MASQADGDGGGGGDDDDNGEWAWMDGIYGGDRAKKLVDRQMCKCKEVTLLPRGRIEVNLTAHRA